MKKNFGSKISPTIKGTEELSNLCAETMKNINVSSNNK